MVTGGSIVDPPRSRRRATVPRPDGTSVPASNTSVHREWERGRRDEAWAGCIARVAVGCLIPVAAIGLDGATALAWSNGVDGPDGYGTHDWILDQALGALGDRVDWVCPKVALRATDDPDTIDGLDHASGTWWHVYDVWGEDTYGDAPEAAAVWYRITERRLRAGDECAASRALGIMAHLVGDIAQPMHTDGGEAEDRVHSAYESAVDSRSEIGDDDYEFHFDGIDPASPRSGTVALARQAHHFYRALVTIYDKRGYDARVHEITQRQLDRAANVLADLIASIA